MASLSREEDAEGLSRIRLSYSVQPVASYFRITDLRIAKATLAEKIGLWTRCMINAGTRRLGIGRGSEGRRAKRDGCLALR
jgi:hypothetical protein